MYLKLVNIISFLLLSFYCCCQDISGTWVGNYERVPFVIHPEKIVVELFLTNDSLITGASHLYYKDKTYEHYKIKGVYDKKRKLVYFSEDSTIAVKLGFMIDNCLGNYSMRLTTSKDKLELEGTWRDNSKRLFNCPSTGVWLEKLNEEQTPAFTENESIQLPEKKDSNLQRSSDIQSLIELGKGESDSVRIDIYDNGVIDNDYVSVYFNDSLVISNKMISQTPISFTLHLVTGKINKLKLASESEGSIPPCTAFMIVQTNKKRYEVNLSSDPKTNAVVEFFMKE